MTEQVKKAGGWLGRNFLALIIIALVTAFFIDFQSFKQHEREDRLNLEKTVKENQLMIYGGRYDIDQLKLQIKDIEDKQDEYDEDQKEIWKMLPRGGKSSGGGVKLGGIK